MNEYDSRTDTMAHIARVSELLDDVKGNLSRRAAAHDASKLETPEKEIFDEMTPKLKGCTYGSDEYKWFLATMKPALDHHYAANAHHPEHWMQIECVACREPLPADGVPSCPRCGGGRFEPVAKVCEMSLLDLVEMLCDWRAAGERHADGSMAASLAINRKRFQISDEMFAVIERTAREMGWTK